MRVEITFLVIFLCVNLNEARHVRKVDDVKDDQFVNSFLWRSEGKKCEPFTVIQMDCNRCVCSANGVPYCTKMGCINMMKLRRHPNIIKTLTRVKHNTNFDFNDIEH